MRRWPEATFLTVFACAAFAWIAAILRGHFDGHALVNAEIAMTIAFLALAALRAHPSPHAPASPPNRWIGPLICLAIPIAYAGVTRAGFLYDDFLHVAGAGRTTWTSALAGFGPVPNPPGLFFRPLGFLFHWWNYLAAGRDPSFWHAVNLALHALNSLLILAFCRALRFTPATSAAAALLFALNAAAVESATWIDARFDPMAAAFALACLLSLLHRRIAAAALLAALAVLCKESAFCLPLLAAALLFFRRRQEWPQLVRGIAMVTAVSCAMFAYRWWALGGLGGYRAPSGEALATRLDIAHSLKAVLIQDWTIMFFPVNWLQPMGPATLAVALLAPAILAACAWRSAIERRVLLGALALTLAAALPVHNMLLIGPDLSGGRVLYMLSIGWAVLWAGLFGANPRPWLVAAVIAWHAVMLRHNLGAWLERHEEAKAVCASFAAEIRNEPDPVSVQGLPQKKGGVVFLANGFSDCVGRYIEIREDGAMFVWNAKPERLQRRAP